jgi:IS1 family transposase
LNSVDLGLRFKNYHKGRNLGRQQWVFGAYDVTQKIGCIKFVQKRDAANLLPIIQIAVLPGSMIVSDEWRAYRGIANLPGNYQHQTVNHNQNFVDPLKGAHTNHAKYS